MTINQTDTTTTYIDLAVDVIDPDPHNQTRRVDKQFINSIAAVGVVEPILVVAHPDNPDRYLLVAGERRWTAATSAGLATVPAIVRTDLDEAARIELQTVENLQRSDLSPCQEAHQLMRLSAVGHSVAKVAKTVGRSQRVVRERLRLVELPKAAQNLIDSGAWSIEAGLAALDLIDLPDALAELIEQNPRNVTHAVEQTLNRIAFEADAAALIQEAIDAGIAVLEIDAKYDTLTSLDVEETAHRSEPCHAVILQGGGLRGKARLVGVCTKVTNHRQTGASKIKTATRPGLSEAERKARAAKKEADENRLAAMTTIASARLSKTAAHELIIAALLNDVGADPAKRACVILDIDPATSSGWADHGTALRTYAAKSAPNQLRAATVIAMVKHDASYKSGWRSDGYRWSQWLQARGWKPTAHDRTHIKSLRKNTSP